MPNGLMIQANNENPYTSWGVADQQILMLDAISANDVGIWLPLKPFCKGSLEVTSAGTMAGTVSLLVSNAAEQPSNGFTVTVDASVLTPGDVLAILVASPLLFQSIPNLPSGIIGTHVVAGGDTSNSIAAALGASLAAQINFAGQHQIFGQQASAFGAAISILVVGAVINITYKTLPVGALPVLVQNISAGGATETLTLAQYDSGLGSIVPNSQFTAPGITKFDMPGAWFKVALSGWSSGAITAIVQLSIP